MIKDKIFSHKYVRGFTLIELLVVIAIIGILSSVVLASLNSARVKGAVASAKSNMANTRAQAEIFYDTNTNSYNLGGAATNVCLSTASVGTPAVKGIYPGILAAVQANTASGTVTSPWSSTAPATAGNGVCNAVGATGWAAEVVLKDGNFYCVDGTGASKQSATDMITTAIDIAC